MDSSTLMVQGPPAQQPPLDHDNHLISAFMPTAAQSAADSDALIVALVPAAAEPAADSSMPLGLPSDMMSRFEELSRAFRSEVEGLVGKEKENSRETAEQLHERIATLEQELEAQTSEAQLGAARVCNFLRQHKSTWLEHVFGNAEPPEAPDVSVAGFRGIVEGFMRMSEGSRDPEREAASAEISQLKQQVSAQDTELATLRGDLREARILKSQEERDLAEFRSLREKESDLQEANLKISQLSSQLEELQATQNILMARASQSEAALGDKSRKIVTLMKELEKETEQCRQLSNENNTLQLNLGKDSDYIKVLKPIADPLSHTSRAGGLSDDLKCEERKLRDDLSMALFKFPGLATGSENCQGWCEAQISRQCSLHRSFLHLLQDFRQDAPDGLDINFVSKTREVDEAWLQREDEMRGTDAVFRDSEKALAKQWEEKRLELIAERDGKIKQLMEQADRSQTRAEKQLLMQQAKLFGQRMDAQIERAWADQRKERDERWVQHNQAKQESRQKFKDKSLSVQQHAEGLASAADRFQDMARARLSGPEDAWVRNVDKVSTVSASVLKGQNLGECLKAAGLESRVVPKKGSQFGGISSVAQAVEDLLSIRSEKRKELSNQLEEHTLQQLRHCIERFIQNEGLHQQPKKNQTSTTNADTVPDYMHASTIESLLRARQHRVASDTIRRQFHDFMLVLRIAALAATHLLPDGVAEHFSSRDIKLDLPPVPQELKDELASSKAKSDCDMACDDVKEQSDCKHMDSEDGQVEGQIMYHALMRRLLDRLLTPMHSKHREELLALKRTHAKEIRTCLQHLCQLEPASIDKCADMDVEEYKAQIKTKLLSDCEYHVCEERRHLCEQIDDEVNTHVTMYQHQIAEEERAGLRDRKKWLTERLVVMHAQGAGCLGDRAVIQHLRSELRACELRFEMRDRELMETEASNANPSKASLELKSESRLPSPASPSTTGERTRHSPTQVLSSNSGQPHVPAPPIEKPPARCRPSRGASPKPPSDMTFQIGRPSGGPSNAANLQFPGCGSGDLAGAGPPCGAPQASDSVARKRPPGAPSIQAAVNMPDQSIAPVSPSFGRSRADSSGADGGAGFGRSPSFGELSELGKPSQGYGKDSGAVLDASLHLYDWPFAPSDLMCEVNSKPANEPQNKACTMPEILPPLKPVVARPMPHEKGHNLGSYSAGLSLGGAPLAGSSLKSPRQLPQVLPPMTSPRTC